MKKSIKRTTIFGLFFALLAALCMSVILYNGSAKVNADTASTEFYMETGAYIRTAEPTGLRFRAAMDSDTYNTITADSTAEYEVGMYIFPANYLTNQNAYNDGATIGDYKELKQKLNPVFYDSDNSSVENKIYLEDGKYYVNGVVSNILLANYDLDYVGVAYIAKTESGNTTYTYADVAESNKRSVAEVSAKGYIAATESDKEVLNDFIVGTYLKQVGATYDMDSKKYSYNSNTYDSFASLKSAANVNLSLELSQTALTLSNFADQTLSATIKNNGAALSANALDKFVVWSTSNANVATVNGGVVKLISEGTATITASLGAATASCTITLTDGRTTSSLLAVDFDLSKNTGLTLSVGTGETPVAVAVNGTNVTENATLTSGSATVAYSDLSGVTPGTNATVTVYTAEKIYTCDTFVASFVISDNDEWVAFLNDLKTNGTNTSLYAVLDDNVTVTTSDSVNGHNFYGTLDGRGHTVDCANGFIKLFGNFEGTIKNIAFTNYTTHSNNNGMNHAFFHKINGTLENVYLHVKSMVKPSGGQVSSVANNVYSKANLNNVIIKTDCTSSIMPSMLGVGNTGFDNNATLNNVYFIADSAIYTTPNSHSNQYDTLKSWYDANENSALFNDNVWGVSRGYLTLGGNKLGLINNPQSIGEVYYATSTAQDFKVTGFSGTAEEVIIDGTDVTSYCTLSTAGEISVSSTAMSTLSNGEHTVSIATSQALYSATLVVGTYVLSTSEEFVFFFKTTYTGATGVKTGKATTNATSSWYVVVANDITVTDSTYTGNGAHTTSSTSSEVCKFMGVFDGRGHVISNITVQRSIFGLIRGNTAIIKNVSFVNGKTTLNSNSHQGFLVIGASDGAVIDNVYIQYTSSGASGDNVGFISSCDSVTIKNCVVNVSFNSSASISSFVGGSRYVNVTCSNFYAVSNINHSSTNSAVNLSLSVDAMIANFLNEDDNTYALPSGFNDYWSINSMTGEMKFGTATVYAGNAA